MEAPGRPGIGPTWTSSAKDLVTTSLGPSRLWATFGYGIVNEVYYPTTGQPQIRDLGFIVAVGDRWYELKRVHRYTLSTPAPVVPLAQYVHEGDGYRLELEAVPDPHREVLLLHYRLEGKDARLYPLLAPHLGIDGHDNTAWVDGGALWASGTGAMLTLQSDCGIVRGSAGYVGVSDGWQDFHHNDAMTWQYSLATHGNVALMAELPGREGVLALGFAADAQGAHTRARSAMAEGYPAIRQAFEAGWRDWAATLTAPALEPPLQGMAMLSATVLKVHEDKSYPGALVASLSIPWGNSRNDLGGYHLVWPRDAVQAGLGLLASGQVEDARRMMAYLMATQQPDGRWFQNAYPDGRSFWTGVQLDEVGFPIILAAKLHEFGALDGLHGVASMVREAAGFIARTGPLSPQDRWEENAGANPFTLAIEVAALVAADGYLNEEERAYAAELADDWNERIEDWTYVAGGALADEHGVDGYYLRMAPAGTPGLRGEVTIRNRDGLRLPAAELVSLDYLALARFGLRAADDPRIVDTTRVVDAMLKVNLPTGEAYHRYNEDGYGEHEDGSPFDGTGIGRAWPLLASERAHQALQQGQDPLPALRAMAAMSGPGGLIPEQVWDAAPIPSRHLDPGHPSGSAMPLVWAHAEFLKLAVAIEHGRPLELLDAVAERYPGAARPTATTWHWRASLPFASLPAGKALQVEALAPFELSFALDGGSETSQASGPLPFGLHGVTLTSQSLTGHDRIRFRLAPRDGSGHGSGDGTADGVAAVGDLALARKT